MKGIVLAFVLIVILVALGPLCTIWALNTLFPGLHIPYTLETWLSVVILGGLFKTHINKQK